MFNGCRMEAESPHPKFFWGRTYSGQPEQVPGYAPELTAPH